MRSILKYVYTSCIILGAFTGLSQEDSLDTHCNYTLSGHITDPDNNESLAYAVIIIKELQRSQVAGEDGQYMFKGLCKGTYTVVCKHIGCEPVEAKVKVTKNTTKNFRLPHSYYEIGKTVIAVKKPKEENTQASTEIKAKELFQTRGLSLGESLKEVPGVNSMNTGSSISKPVIHGLHSNRVLILNNGIRQEGQQWGAEHAPEVDPLIADKLTVVKGANSVQYGSDAIAGVILVEPKPLRKKTGTAGELTLSGFSNNRQFTGSGMLEGNLEKWQPFSWRIQGTYKHAGNAKTPDYYLKNTGFREWNFSATAGYQKERYGTELFYSRFNTNLGIFSASHIGNLTDLKRAFEAEEPLEKADFTYKIDRPFQHVSHQLLKSKSHIKTGNLGKLNFVYALQHNLRQEYDKHKPRNDSLAALNFPELHYEITTHTADLFWEHRRFRGLKGKIGISGITQSNTYEGRMFIPNFYNYSGGIFWIERWKKNKLELEGGLRYDYRWQQVSMWENGEIISPEFPYSNLSGTAGSILNISKNLDWRMNFGTAWRPPLVNELFSNGLHHGAAAIEIGDRDLVPEKAYNFITTIHYHDDKHINSEISFYHNIIDNFIYLEPYPAPVLTIRGAFPAFYYKQANTTFTGIDYVLDYKITSRWVLTSKGSVLRARNKTINNYLVMMPADRFENSLQFNFRDYNSVTGAYISLSAANVLKQTRIPENSDFVEPPDGYMLLNLQSGLTWKTNKQDIEIGFEIKNLFNTSYRDYLNRFRYFADETGRNFILRIKVPFKFNNIKIKHYENNN